MALQPWQIAVLTRVEQETHNTRRFFFEIRDCDRFDFTPGQFITFDLPIHERLSKRLRSYSVASWPRGDNKFRLLIVLLEGGAGTTYLFNEGKPGLEIPFRGPLGHFTLPNPMERDLCLICTGTGIAPFRSQVNYLFENKLPSTHIHLVFGTRYIKDLVYYNELKQLEAQMEKFHFHVTMSREDAPEWKGHKGYVHQVYEAICEKGNKPFEFYLCGWKAMVDDARARLAEMGYSKEHIHLELYG